jgi:hypothetical protein
MPFAACLVDKLDRITASTTLQWVNNAASDPLISRIVLNGKHFNSDLLIC